MIFLSEMEKPRQRTTPTHIFQSEKTALEYLKGHSIVPWPGEKRFVIIAERHYGEKSFDALDYLMYNHYYQVQFV